ncbi:Uncharacterised protein [Flavonifractor plautii]|nr:Uncharacterised protein [Flavonifractor plautii]
MGPEGEPLDPEGRLDHAPQRLRLCLGGGGPDGPGAGQRRPATGDRPAGDPAEEPGSDRPGPGDGPLPLFGGHRPAGQAGRPVGDAAAVGRAPAGGGGPAALGHPVWRPGAVRSAAGPGPHGAARVCPAFEAGALPVRRGLHPRVPGPGDRGRGGPDGRPGGEGPVSVGGGRLRHPPDRPRPRTAHRRRPEPAVLLRAGALPPAGGQAGPGNDHRL